MGFSLLSGAELIYFFTLRYYVDKKKRNAAKSEGKKKISSRSKVLSR
jgi:hypothetical protein